MPAGKIPANDVFPNAQPTTHEGSVAGGRPVARVRLRNPFRVTRLPPLARLYRQMEALRSRPGLAARFQRRLVRQQIRSLRGRAGQEPGAATLEVNGEARPFAFNASNTQFHSLYLPAYEHGYECETAALLDLCLPDDGVLFDIGANWGHVSLHAASRPGFRGRVHAFEPMPSSAADLQSVLRQTRMESLITLHPVALSDQEGAARLVLPDGETSGLATLNAGAGAGVEVRRVRLDDLELPAPSVIKLDVEGHEAAVLNGALRVLKEHAPVVIFESWLGGNLAAALAPFAILARLGYQFFQPALRTETEGLPFLLGYGGTRDFQGDATLVGVPFAAEDRTLLAPQFNVLAVPPPRRAGVA